jgi:entericidin A
MKRMLGLIVVAVLLAGCNTMQGLGQDVQKVGDKIEEKAKRK